mmetsp:Transcript_54606/g.144283  ORF Transcript_54606/g.144283 Transcript_54606/m.144283 type:complete len:237 (-) Transcript_54606:113-823(-)
MSNFQASKQLRVRIAEQRKLLEESVQLFEALDVQSSQDASKNSVNLSETQTKINSDRNLSDIRSSSQRSEKIAEIGNTPPSPISKEKFHLNLSGCVNSDAEESTAGEKKISIEVTPLMSDSFFGEKGIDPRILGASSEEDVLMNYHKDILYEEFRGHLRKRPDGGEVTVDANKLRILLDLMQRHNNKLETQLRSLVAWSMQPDGQGRGQWSPSSDASSASSEHSTPSSSPGARYGR